MSAIPCPVHMPCVDANNPLGNLSAELPDVDLFDGFFTGDPSFPPPLGSNWTRNSCLGLCQSSFSQQDADFCAYINSLICVTGDWGPPGDRNNGGPRSGPPVIPAPSNPLHLFYNDALSYPFPCTFGGVINIPVRAGMFVAASKAAANAIALSWARSQGSRIREVSNDQQCYTAHCPGGDPYSAQSCIAEGTYGECLLDPTPEALAAAKDFYNDAALGAATADANELLAEHGCQVCNTEANGFGSCPGDPTKIAHGHVPAGTYCVPAGGSQDAVDAQASQDMYNQIQSGLLTLGCACTGGVNRATQVLTYQCDTFIQVLTAGGSAFPAPLSGTPPGSGIFHVAPGGTFDWAALWHAFIGGTFSGVVRILGISYTAPEIRLYYP